MGVRGNIVAEGLSCSEIPGNDAHLQHPPLGRVAWPYPQRMRGVDGHPLFRVPGPSWSAGLQGSRSASRGSVAMTKARNRSSSALDRRRLLRTFAQGAAAVLRASASAPSALLPQEAALRAPIEHDGPSLEAAQPRPADAQRADPKTLDVEDMGLRHPSAWRSWIHVVSPGCALRQRRPPYRTLPGRPLAGPAMAARARVNRAEFF